MKLDLWGTFYDWLPRVAFGFVVVAAVDVVSTSFLFVLDVQ